MNRTLWKLDRIGERLWSLATLTATQAAALANDGKGMAVVAEETRKMAHQVNEVVEKATFDDLVIDKEKLVPLAIQLNHLALNSAFEAYRLGHLGKSAAVCSEEVRNLSHEIVCLFDKDAANKKKKFVHPWPKNPLTSISKSFYLHFNIGDIHILENLDNIKEVYAGIEHTDGFINLRGMELPLVDGYKMLGSTQETPIYVILSTPWAEQNKTYAVTADDISIHYTPAGKSIDTPSGMPLAKYVRECWANEDDEMFYFMDWVAMVKP